MKIDTGLILVYIAVNWEIVIAP